MKKEPIKAPIPAPLPGRLTAASWIGAVAGALLILWGQWAIFQSDFATGVKRTVAGLLLAGVAMTLPLLQWGRLAREALAALRALKPAPKPAPTTAAQAVAAGPSAPLRLFASDQATFSRHLLLVPLAVLLIHAQWKLLNQSTMAPILDLLLGAVIAAIYLQGLDRPLVLPNLNENAKALLGLVPGLALTLPGAYILWGYQHELAGFALVLMGGALLIISLARLPLRLVATGGEALPSLDCRQSGSWDKPAFLGGKAALVAGALVAWLAASTLDSAHPGWSVSSEALAILLLLASFPWVPAAVGRLGGGPTRALGAASGAVLAFALAWHGQGLMDAGHQNAALLDFLAGGVLLILALPDVPLSEAPDQQAAASRRLEILLFVALVLVSFSLRVWNLEHFPYGAEGDEAGGGVYAVDVLKGRVDNPLVSANVPLLYYSVTALFFKLAGVSIASMRWHAAVFGTLSVISLYFFLRLFYGAVVGLLVTALMSASYWSLHFSRFGHYNIEQVCLQMVAFYFAFRGLKFGRLRDWVLGGLAFGLAMMPHLASRLLPFEALGLVLYLLLSRRDLLRAHATGLLAFVLCAWMMAAPALTYWLRAVPQSVGRAQSVSIFDRTNSNAPSDVLSGFTRNVKVSLLMFNSTSDSRPRDNPLAPNKILESVTAALFAIAFLYVLYHWRNPLNLLLLVTFGINLAASILSVEAPQTLRTAGNISIVIAMIAVPLDALRRSLMALGPRKGWGLFLLLVVPLATWGSYRSAKAYFVGARNLTFDNYPTYVAMSAGTEGGPKTQAVFWATGFASSHPPVMLFAQSTPIRNFYELADYLPISEEAGREHLLYFCDVYEPMAAYYAAMYGGVTVTPIPNLTAPGSDICSWIRVSPEAIRRTQGLELSQGGKALSGNADLAWPQKGLPASSGRLHWRGSVRMDAYGFYRFTATGSGDCTVKLMGRTVLTRAGGEVSSREARLPMGLIPIEVDYSPKGDADFRVQWSGRPHPQHLLYSLRSDARGSLEKRQLFTLPPQGFYARYYPQRDFSGDSVMDYVSPQVLAHWLDSPLPGAYSVVHHARLSIDKPGLYSFQMDTFGSYAEIRVDHKLVHLQGVPLVPWLKPPVVLPNIQLGKGQHDLEVRFSTAGASWYVLHWSGPDASGLVPTERLSPVYPDPFEAPR